jgi:hypothetical protein
MILCARIQEKRDEICCPVLQRYEELAMVAIVF